MVCVAKFSSRGLKSSIRGTIQKCNAAHAMPKTKPAASITQAVMRRAELSNWDSVENFSIRLTIQT